MQEIIPEKCQECKLVSLETGYSFRQKEDGSTKYMCFHCAYDEDKHEQLTTGILRSSLSTTSYIKNDWKIFKPFFELETIMVPLFQEIWNKYKNHETLNDPNFKRGIVVDTNTNTIYSRTWEQSSKEIIKQIPKDSLVIEIFDSMCGYVGMEIYSAHSDHGMWIQGQLRSKESQPWYRSCYCTLEYAKEVSDKVENFLGLRKDLMVLEQVVIATELGNTYRLPKSEFFCEVT